MPSEIPSTANEDNGLTDSPGDPARPIAAPVGAAAARGFYWLIALSLFTKSMGMGTQIVLSWFVSSVDFGYVGTALTIASFIWLMQDAGLTQILIKRQRRFDIWSTPIFWLSLFLAAAAALLTAGSGLLLGPKLHEPILIGLLFLLAVRVFASAPSTVPVARINSWMRFDMLALIGLAMVTLERSLMLLFTSPWVRWGAYGWILALMITTGIRTLVLWWYAKPPVKMQLQFRRWKYIYRDSWLLTMALGFQTITVYGDNLLLAIFRPAAVVGIYYWAYNLSLQTTMLLTSNLGGVLFPALSKLQREPERMRQGFVRAARMLTMIGIPGCFLQAALARPIVTVVFGSRWLPAVPALQVLSLGMAFGLVNYPAIGLLRAQGRFSTERSLSAVCAGMFLLAAFLGAWLGGALSMAIAVAIYNLAAGILFVRLGIGNDWRKVFSIFFLPTLWGAVAVGLGYVLSQRIIATTRLGCVEQMALTIAVSGIIYTIAARVFMPDIWQEAVKHARPIVRRIGRLFGIGTTERA